MLRALCASDVMAAKLTEKDFLAEDAMELECSTANFTVIS